eukprot:CAMPEP_0194283352 /NCGR_PEP_ID=MMETSP0169-20130528/25176_1 /TAXON_ID=218684 /ORGANISM="Corethron pennatum, Strain L29A3" /LENGTH=399 /DNA_ID=CAMNT_0039028927 /DNA_START=62 /DNA_END=1261 /DNA_ORIENTATION=+
MTSQAARLPLAFFLLRVVVTTEAFQAITSSSPAQQLRLPKRAPATFVSMLPSSIQKQRQQYSHTNVLWKQQLGPSIATVSSTTLLRSSSFENDETSSDETKLQKKIAARKKRVEIGYQASALAFALVTCIAFVKFRFYQPLPIPLMLYMVAGSWMASSVAFHLVGSGSNDRLKTDSCKRLNLALASFGFIGLLAKDIIATTAQPLWIFACLVAMINSIKGYGYGLKGWDLKMMDGNAGAVKDIFGGSLTSLQSIFSLPAIFSRSTGYAALAVTFIAMKCVIMYKLISHIVAAGPMNKMVLLTLAFQCKKLLLLIVAALTLKEAVDQNETESPKGWGAAPVGLGLATAAATGFMAAHSITLGSVYLGGWIALLAVFSTVDGINRWTALNLPIKVAKTRVN